MSLLASALSCISATYLFMFLFLLFLQPKLKPGHETVVVILGNLGPSPRMCRHALSFANSGCIFDLAEFKKCNLMAELVYYPLIYLVRLGSISSGGKEEH